MEHLRVETRWPRHQPSPGEHSRECIQLWLLDLGGGDDDLSGSLELLSAEERRQAGRFHFARHRRQFVVRRAALRRILAAYLGATPQALSFCTGDHGKPSLAGAHAGAELCFNTSSSEELGLVAVRRALPLGVDVERVAAKPDLEGLARAVFTPEELARLPEIGGGDAIAGFFRLWSAKEAYVKLDGRGLSRELRSFSLAPTAGQRLRLSVAEEGGEGVVVQTLELPSGWAGAVASSAGFARVEGYTVA